MSKITVKEFRKRVTGMLDKHQNPVVNPVDKLIQNLKGTNGNNRLA